MDRMSALDSGFFFAESENTPMHVGSVTVFEGPAPSYGDMVRLLLSKLSLVPRYRQRVREIPLRAGPPGVGRRPALPDPVPRAAHGGAGPGQRRAAAQPGRPRARPAPGHVQAAVGAVAGRGPGRQPLGDHLQGPPLHGRRHRRHRPDAADVRPRARRRARRPQGLDAAAPAVEPHAAHRGGHRGGGAPAAGAPVAPRPVRRGQGREVARRVGQDGRLDHAVGREAGDHPDRPLAERADRPAPALGLDRGQVRGVQGRPDVVRRHGQRRRPRLDHRRLPRSAAGPRRAVVGAARRPLDGAGVGPDREPEGLPGQPGVRGLRRPAGRSRRPDRATDLDPRPDGRVQEDDVGGRRQLDHRDGQLRRADPARARRTGRDVRRPVLGPGSDHQRARAPVPALRARQADGLGARLRTDRRWHPLLHRDLLLPGHDDLRHQRRLRRLPRRRRPLRRHPARSRRTAHPGQAGEGAPKKKTSAAASR